MAIDSKLQNGRNSKSAGTSKRVVANWMLTPYGEDCSDDNATTQKPQKAPRPASAPVRRRHSSQRYIL